MNRGFLSIDLEKKNADFMETLKEFCLSLCIEDTMENDSETLHTETVVTTLCTIVNVSAVLEDKSMEKLVQRCWNLKQRITRGRSDDVTILSFSNSWSEHRNHVAFVKKIYNEKE